MDFDPHDLTQEKLHEYRSAAEQAWGDDTRHPNFVGHPLPAAGQCYVTSRWLKDKLGGHVAVKGGHYHWLSPDKEYAVDLTGDQHSYLPANPEHEGILQDAEDEGWTYEPHHQAWRPGPVIFKHASHSLFKGARIMDPSTENQRVKLFKQRANAALEGRLEKQADSMGPTPYSGETPEKMENYYYHDQPKEFGPEEYKFVYAAGKLELDPSGDYDRLAQRLNLKDESYGPSAVGRVLVLDGGKAQWEATSNVSLSVLANVLRDYTSQAGWEWGGLTDQQGNKLSKTMWWVWDDHNDRLLVSHKDPRDSQWKKISITGKVASVGPEADYDLDALQEWAEDFGYVLAANDNEMKRHEDLELNNNWGPRPDFEQNPSDDSRPNHLQCKICGEQFNDWSAYIAHDHFGSNPRQDVEQDGHFPEMDMDKALKPHFHEREPFVFPLASIRRTASILDAGWEVSSQNLEHYGAHLNGELVGAASITRYGGIVQIKAVHRPDLIISALVSKLQAHYDELQAREPLPGFVPRSDGTYRWAAGKDPKDQIDNPIPFVYDVDSDKIVTGQPGQHTHNIQGNFTPGALVEGFYEPGGKVVITTQSQYPYSTRHMLDLWYWSYPHMQITGLEYQTPQGERQKLASTKTSAEIGQYIRTLALADPAAWNSYKALQKAGGHVYVVGGAVRDALMGKEPKDIDMMVTGIHPEAVGALLEKLPGKVDLTGKDFGVFRYRTKGAEVEIALPRTERSTGDRRVDFDVSVDHKLPVESDLLRRDFTANAMAVSLDSGRLIDPYGGAQDIENRTLRTVHPNSFGEDPTRLVRGLVAHSKHGLIPDEQTRSQMGEHAHRIDLESPDRIGTELTKLMQSPDPASAIRLAHETGVLKHLLPELDTSWDYDSRNPHHALTLGNHHMQVLEGVQNQSKDPDLRLAAALHDIGKPASRAMKCLNCNSVWHENDHGFTCPSCGSTDTKGTFHGNDGVGHDHATVGAAMTEQRLKALRFSNARVNRIHDLIHHHMFPAFGSPKGARKFLNRVGEHADDLLTLRHADMYGKGTDEYQDTKTPVDDMRAHVESVRNQAGPTSQADLAINGNQLMQSLGIRPGPQVGQILNALTEDVIEDPTVNDQKSLLELARGEYERMQGQQL